MKKDSGPDRGQIAGVLLAGGHGRRLGGIRKADLRIGGVRLLDRAIASIGPQVGWLMIACGTERVDMRGRYVEIAQVSDGVFAGRGPAAGLLAAAHAVHDDARPYAFLVSLAVDTPFAPADLVDRLAVAMTPNTDAVFPVFDGQDYPTNGLWRVDALVALRQPAQFGARAALRSLLPPARVERVEFQAGNQGNPFANVNAPDDLVAFARMSGNSLAPRRIGVLAKPDKPAKRTPA